MTRAPDTPYRHRAWKQIRPEILNRDGHRCRIQGPGCTGHATHVDHIIPWQAGGSWFDPNNLRAACPHCNSSRARRTTTPQQTQPQTPSRNW